jgi:hypothetical protein
MTSIKIQRKSVQDVAYEKNFPKYLAHKGNSSTKRQYKELILYDGFMMQRLFETIINEHIVFEDR